MFHEDPPKLNFTQKNNNNKQTPHEQTLNPKNVGWDQMKKKN
jgi:hypothetical protein